MPAAYNQLKGRVSEATFLGNIVDYQVDVGGELSLRVQGDRRGFPRDRNQVLLTVPVEECVLMNSETGMAARSDGGPSAD